MTKKKSLNSVVDTSFRQINEVNTKRSTINPADLADLDLLLNDDKKGMAECIGAIVENNDDTLLSLIERTSDKEIDNSDRKYKMSSCWKQTEETQIFNQKLGKVPLLFSMKLFFKKLFSFKRANVVYGNKIINTTEKK